MSNSDFDFGFSMVDADGTKESESTISAEKARLEGLLELFMPMLSNLKSEPDKDYLYWPNRVEKIDEFMKRVRAYIDT